MATPPKNNEARRDLRMIQLLSTVPTTAQRVLPDLVGDRSRPIMPKIAPKPAPKQRKRKNSVRCAEFEDEVTYFKD